MACVGSGSGDGGDGGGRRPCKHPWEKQIPTDRITVYEMRKKKRIPCVPYVPMGDMSGPRLQPGVVPPGAKTTPRKAEANVRTAFRRQEMFAALPQPEQQKQRSQAELAIEQKKKKKKAKDQTQKREASEEEFVKVLPEPIDPAEKRRQDAAKWKVSVQKGRARLRKTAEKKAAKEKKEQKKTEEMNTAKGSERSAV